MKILVPLKRVPDYAAKVQISADSRGIVTDGIKWVTNPFDEIALEEAIRIKEKGQAAEVVAVTIGPSDASLQLRGALALGADTAVHILAKEELSSDAVARTLAELFRRDAYSLIILGKQSVDTDASQVHQMLAALLDLPQACFASSVTVDGSSVTVTREVDGGLETLSMPLPAVVSTDLRLNEPRRATLQNIAKSKKKTITEMDIASLGADLAPRTVIRKLKYPAARKGGRRVRDIAELVAALKSEFQVIR